MIDENRLIEEIWINFNSYYNDASRFSEEETKMADRVWGGVQCMIESQPKVGEWIPADDPPKTDDYILLSFENFTIPMVGRYEKFEDGSGNYYLGDCDEKDTCLANNLFVNGWQPLPAPYRPDQETSEQPKAAWKEAMMRTFLGRNT